MAYNNNNQYGGNQYSQYSSNPYNQGPSTESGYGHNGHGQVSLRRPPSRHGKAMATMSFWPPEPCVVTRR
jgi:hypothetical protein